MPRVAVFDRPEDSRDVTARLYGRLAAEFGKSRVTRGTSTPEPTDDSDVVVVVIGPSWLTAADADGRRRLDEPTDVVRNQIQRALAAGVIVIPVLLGRTQMPRPDELPPGLAQLPFQNGMQLRSDPDFHKDVGRLIKAIRYPARPASQRPRLDQLTKFLARGRKGAFAGALLALVCAIVWLMLNPGPSVAGNVALGVLFAVWPLGWLVIWWRQRQTRQTLLACFLLPLLPAASAFLSILMGGLEFEILVFFGLIGVRISVDDNPLKNEPLLLHVLWNLCSGMSGCMVGILLGSSTSGKKPDTIDQQELIESHPPRSRRRSIVLGSLLGFLIGAVLHVILSRFYPERPKVSASSLVAEFIVVVLSPLMMLWAILGAYAATLDTSDR